jgi:hypothetical protein
MLSLPVGEDKRIGYRKEFEGRDKTSINLERDFGNG